MTLLQVVAIYNVVIDNNNINPEACQETNRTDEFC